jgi:hypothetical protein
VQAALHFWPTVHRSLPANMGLGFDAVLPAGSAIGMALVSALYTTGLILCITGFLAAMVKARWLRLVLFVLGAMLLAGTAWGNGADLAKQFLAEAIVLAVIVFGVRRVIRFNVLGALVAVGCLALLSAAVELLGQPEAFYRTNGYAVVLAMLVLLLYPLALWRMRSVAPLASESRPEGFPT